MKLGKRGGESILNIVSSLTGAAWRLLEDFDVSTAEGENAFDDIMKKVDQHFQYDDRVRLPGDFDAYFVMSRKSGQSIMEYVTRHDEYNRRLQRHGIELPESVQGWHLLRKCNLTKEQRQLINLRAPQLEKKKVIETLYLVLGQDHRAASGPLLERRWQGKGHRGRSYSVQDEYVDDEIYGTEDYDGSEAWDESGYHEWDPSPSHHDEAEYYEDPEAFDSSAAYYQYDDETAEEHPWHDVESYDQAYAAYLDARKRFNYLKISRGYLPVVALTDPAAGNVRPGVLSPSSAGSSPKGKKGKSKGTLLKRQAFLHLHVHLLRRVWILVAAQRRL